MNIQVQFPLIFFRLVFVVLFLGLSHDWLLTVITPGFYYIKNYKQNTFWHLVAFGLSASMLVKCESVSLPSCLKKFYSIKNWNNVSSCFLVFSERDYTWWSGLMNYASRHIHSQALCSLEMSWLTNKNTQTEKNKWISEVNTNKRSLRNIGNKYSEIFGEEEKTTPVIWHLKVTNVENDS